jgi:FKBP-type peptidyl-prolyl cis-trans isomerase
MKKVFGFMLLFFAIFVSGCKDKAELQKEQITQYLSDKGLTGKGQFTDSGLYYIIDVAGTGTKPDISSTVEVKYTGTLLDGTQFDSSSSQATGTATFALLQVIKGWQEGIPFFKEGGKGKLIIPSALGYGSQKQSKIPKNSVLVFDIELVDVK